MMANGALKQTCLATAGCPNKAIPSAKEKNIWIHVIE